MNNCCKNPDIVNMDYRLYDSQRYGHFGAVMVENRHCNNCGHHWWAGEEYTRKEWDELNRDESTLGE